MKCPDCRAEMALDALTCRCGWKASSTPRHAAAQAPAQGELAAPADPAARERAMKQIRAMYRRRETGSKFEHWTRNIRQETVDWLVAQAAPEQAKDKCLCRMQAEFVIDAKFRLIPLEQRAALRAQARAERMAFEAEVEARGQVQQGAASG